MARPWSLQACQSRNDHLWYVKLFGGNGEIVMRSHGFEYLKDATRLCEDIRAADIAILDPVPGQWLLTARKNSIGSHYVSLLRDSSPEVLWGAGYSRSDAARRACARLRDVVVVIREPAAVT